MKKICITTVLAILSIMALAYFASPTKALVYTYYPKPNVSSNGNNWSFKTVDQTSGVSFSGNKIIATSIVASYWNVDPITGGLIDQGSPTPKNLVINDNQVNLVFDGSNLPAHIQFVSITGELTDGTTFDATGPGWAFGNVH